MRSSNTRIVFLRWLTVEVTQIYFPSTIRQYYSCCLWIPLMGCKRFVSLYLILSRVLWQTVLLRSIAFHRHNFSNQRHCGAPLRYVGRRQFKDGQVAGSDLHLNSFQTGGLHVECDVPSHHPNPNKVPKLQKASSQRKTNNATGLPNQDLVIRSPV